jgi:hypothetical protein
MLTAAHVVGSLSEAHGPQPIEVLLGEGPAVLPSDPRIGVVLESHPPEPCREIEVDASVVLADSNVGLHQVVRQEATSRCPRDLNSMPEGDDLIVYKRGINPPGLTAGLLDTTPTALGVELPCSDGTAIRRDYIRGYFVVGTETTHPFARPGDSGSIVIDEDDCVLGLIVAMQTDNPSDPKPDDPAFIVAITDVLEALNLELLGPNRPCLYELVTESQAPVG